VVAAMYHFVHILDIEAMKPRLLAHCVANDILGTILLAHEGLNATVAGSREGIDSLLAYLRADARFASLIHKESQAPAPPFLRMKVKLKREIVTMGVPATDPTELTGTRVDAVQWNQLIEDPDVLVVDTRNAYEHGIGSFKNAVSPETETFREFPEFVKNKLDPEKHQKIAMFCTGGIRCEKASNYLLKEGFAEVYHLDGGILRYLETVNEQASLWRGECFVFDDRVAVDANLAPGSYSQCSACRWPLSAADRASRHYEHGISCPHCHDKLSAEKIAGLSERKHQQQLAQQRGRGEPGQDTRD